MRSNKTFIEQSETIKHISKMYHFDSFKNGFADEWRDMANGSHLS